jgi:hypothetical protein
MPRERLRVRRRRREERRGDMRIIGRERGYNN